MNKRIVFNLFPNGKNKAVTFSYDDGKHQDRRLVELLNKYDLKGTFHLNSSRDHEEFVCGDEIKTLFAGHEVSLHSVTHPSLEYVPKVCMVNEVWEDRRKLESIVGYPVVGMSYPNGSVVKEVVKTLRECGVVYSRTTQGTFKFDLPEDYLMWHPTCHHSKAMGLLAQFQQEKRRNRPYLFYVWGHSFEFDRGIPENNWEMIETFCEKIAHDDDVWYATNIEVYNYHQALRSLRFSVDCSMVENPTALDLWFTADEKEIKIGPGEFLNL